MFSPVNVIFALLSKTGQIRLYRHKPTFKNVFKIEKNIRDISANILSKYVEQYV